jgi:cytoskeletal protein CcmA (bactofilin family)
MSINLDGILGVSATGNITGNYILGNGSQLTGIVTSNVDLGNISQNVIPSSNVTYSLGNSTNQWLDLWVSNSTIYLNSVPISLSATNDLLVNNVPVVLSSNSAPPQTANIATTANIIAGNVVVSNATVGAGVVFADGTVQYTAAGSSNYGDSNVSAYLSSGVNTDGIDTTGNVTANYFIGDGSLLTGLPAGYSNADVATYLASNSNVTITTTGNVTTTANISGAYILGNGSQLTGLPASYGNANVADYLPTYTGNLTSGEFSTTGNVVASGNVTGGNFSTAGNILGGGNFSVTGNAQASNISTTGNVSVAGNIVLGGDISAQGNVSTANIVLPSGALLQDGNSTILTGNYNGSNTTVGTITMNTDSTISIESNQSITLGIGATGYIDITSSGIAIDGNITASTGVGAYNLTGWNNISGNTLSTSGNVYANTVIAPIFTASVGGNVTGSLQAYDGSRGDPSRIDLIGASGLASGDDGADLRITGGAAGGSPGNQSGVGGAIAIQGGYSDNGYSTVQINFGGGPIVLGSGTGNDVILAYNNLESRANISTTGNVSATGNITANYFIGDGSQLTNINAANITGAYGNANVEAYLPTSNTIIAINANIANTNSNVANTNSNVSTNANSISQLNLSVAEGANALSNTNANVANLQSQVNALPVINTIPFVYLTAVANGNGQVFSNVILSNYTSNTSITAFLNGALLENTNYTLAGDVLTVNTYLNTGDNIDIITTLASNVNNVTSGYGNSNVVLFFNDYAGNINPATDNAYTLGDPANVWATVYANTFIGDGSQLTGLPASYGNANVAAYLPTYTGNISAGNISVTGTTNIANANINNWTYLPQLWFVGKFVNATIGTTQNADTLITWNDVNDPQGWWVGGATSRITPGIIGWYQIDYLINWTASGTAGTGQLNTQIRVNDVNVGFSQATNNQTNQLTMMQSRMIYLATITDYITFTVYTTISDQTLAGGVSGCQASVRWIST